MFRTRRSAGELLLGLRVLAFAACVPLITRLSLARQEAILEPRRARPQATARQAWLTENVDRVLRRAPAEALDAEAIERAKTRLVAETVYSSDSQSSLARIFGSALAIGESIEEVRRWPSEIESVQAARLAAAAERYLVPARSVTGYLIKGPAAAAAA